MTLYSFIEEHPLEVAHVVAASIVAYAFLACIPICLFAHGSSHDQGTHRQPQQPLQKQQDVEGQQQNCSVSNRRGKRCNLQVMLVFLLGMSVSGLFQVFQVNLKAFSEVPSGGDESQVIEQAVATRIRQKRSYRDKTTLFTRKQLDAWSSTRLMMPCWPGSFGELRSTFMRSYEFFLMGPPPDHSYGLNLTIVLDDTVYKRKNVGLKRNITMTVKSFFKNPNQIDVRYNPQSDLEKYTSGWNLQQLIRISGDNFTNGDAVKFIAHTADDAMWTSAPMPSDLFDNMGRPRFIARYSPTGWPVHPHLHDWMQTAVKALGKPVMFNGMANFPFVVYRDHLKEFRDFVLNVHSENFTCFDDVWEYLTKGTVNKMCEVCILVHFLWDHHHDDYDWHLEPDHLGKDSRRPLNKYAGVAFNVLHYPHLRPGSIFYNNATYRMLAPLPRIQNHAGQEEYAQEEGFREHFVSAGLRRGFCFSQVVRREPDGSLMIVDPLARQLCGGAGYDVNTDVNIKNEWTFEGPHYGPQWSKWDPNGVRWAHFDRLLSRKTNASFNVTEVKRIFDSAYIRECEELSRNFKARFFPDLEDVRPCY